MSLWLTRRGWAVAVGSLALAGAGRFFAIGELYVLALAGLALVCTAEVWTRTRRVRLRIRRSVQPLRVHAGGTARVEVEATNLGGPAPLLQLTDPVSGTLGARMELGPLAAAEQATATYLLPAERRGKLAIGPAEVALADPLGLSRTIIGAGPPTSLTVYPSTVALVPPLLARGPERAGAVSQVHTRQRIGEDFYGLRDYTAGDDVRRIHWPSTAKLGRPVVREDEVPRRSRVTVLLDTRSSAFDLERFEIAVTAAASVVLACSSRRDPLRLMTVAGADTGFVTSGDGLAHLFDHLAVVALSGIGSLRSSLATACANSVGAVVVVLGANQFDAERDAEAVSAASLRTPALSLIRVWPEGATSTPAGSAGTKSSLLARTRCVDIARAADLGPRWAGVQAQSEFA